MLVRFRTNLGRKDATDLEISGWDKCLRGAEVEVSDRAAEVLLKRKIAEAVDVRGVAKPAEVKGVKSGDVK